MTGGRLKLYRIPFSTNVERIALALAHKGVEVEYVDVDPNDRTPVVEISGQELVPVLVDGDLVLSDSPAILEYLEEKFPEPALFPADPARREELRSFLDWFNQIWKRPPNLIAAEELKSEPDRMNIAYAAKAAIHGWSKALSREVGRYGVTVNCIPPGKIWSEQIMRNYTEEERERVARDEIPLGEFGQPEDVANLVVFLASPLARYMTGTVIPVDGGLRRYAF